MGLIVRISRVCVCGFPPSLAQSSAATCVRVPLVKEAAAPLDANAAPLALSTPSSCATPRFSLSALCESILLVLCFRLVATASSSRVRRCATGRPPSRPHSIFLDLSENAVTSPSRLCGAPIPRPHTHPHKRSLRGTDMHERSPATLHARVRGRRAFTQDKKRAKQVSYTLKQANHKKGNTFSCTRRLLFLFACSCTVPVGKWADPR